LTKNYRIFRWILIFVAAFTALLIFISCLTLIIQRTVSIIGLGEFVEFIKSIYIFSEIENGLLLYSIIILAVFGIPELLVTFLTMARKKSGIDLALILGLPYAISSILLLIFFKYNLFVLIFLILFLLQIVISVLGIRAYYSGQFAFKPSDYDVFDIITDTLVIYCGNEFVKKEAYELANNIRAHVVSFDGNQIEDERNVKSYKYIYFVSTYLNYSSSSPFYLYIKKNHYKGINYYAEIITSSRMIYIFENKKRLKEFKHIIQITYVHMRFGKVLRKKTEKTGKRKK